MNEKKKDPWTDPDPQPGDFDEYLDEMEWTQAIIGPELEKQIERDEEEARRRSLADAPESARSVNSAKR